MSRVSVSTGSSVRRDAQALVKKSDAQIAWWLFLLTFVTYGYFYAGAGWNQNAQFDLTRAIVEQKRFAIDVYASNTGDVSRHGGHVYSNKPPGLSFLAAAPYAVLHAIANRAGADLDDARLLAIHNYLCTLAVVVPFGAIVPAIVFLFGRRSGIDATWAAIVGLAIALATQCFPYATFLIAAVPSGALLLLALLDRRAWSGGFFAGFATVVNYLAAPAVVIFAISHGRKGWWKYIVAAVPMLGFLALYQQLAFGSFAATSIDRLDPRFVTQGAALGVLGAPSLEALWGITFSPYRGLFFFAPVLVMAGFGFYEWVAFERRRGRRRPTEIVAAVAICAIFFLFNVCFNGWEGGFGIGARYLVPLIPLLGVAMLFLRGWQRPLFVGLAAVSFAINFTAAAVDPQPSGTIPRPLTQYLVPLLVHGEFSPDVPITPPWSAATFTGHTSVNRMAHDEAVVFTKHPPGSPESEWSSFNLGESFAGAGDPRSLIPIALVIALGAAAIVRKARRVPPE